MCIKKEFRFACGCVHKNTLRLCENKLNRRRCSGTTIYGSERKDHGCQGHQCPRCGYGIKNYDERCCQRCLR